MADTCRNVSNQIPLKFWELLNYDHPDHTYEMYIKLAGKCVNVQIMLFQKEAFRIYHKLYFLAFSGSESTNK